VTHPKRLGGGLVAFVEKKTTREEVNAALKKASESGPLKGYLGYEVNELVSADFKGDGRSSSSMRP